MGCQYCLGQRNEILANSCNYSSLKFLFHLTLNYPNAMIPDILTPTFTKCCLRTINLGNNTFIAILIHLSARARVCCNTTINSLQGYARVMFR